MSHVDPHGSMGRSRSWTGRSRRSQSPMLDAMSGSCVSRLEVNQSMRERAAGMWLDQLREKQERRQEAMRRKNQLEDRKRNETLHKIQSTDLSAERHKERHQQYLESRSEAFKGRQNYLQQAREHSQLLQSIRSRQVEQDTDLKLVQADANHQQVLEERSSEATRRNMERVDSVRRNQSAINRRRESMAKGKLLTEAQRQHAINAKRERQEEERQAAAQERDDARREAQQRAEAIAEMKRMATASKVQRDSERSSSVLRRRDQWLRERQHQNLERQAQAKESILHAQRVRAAKEQQYSNHFEESLAIGRETAEHNKMFKLNNRIMHELMKDMVSDSRSVRSRSSHAGGRRHY